MTSRLHVVLGSSSPRRRELLGRLVGCDNVDVLPPLDANEPGFDGLHDWPEIEARLLETARAKLDDVAAQLAALQDRGDRIVVCADTVIIGVTDDKGLIVLGKPPDENWQPVVRGWFVDLYFRREHYAATAIVVRGADGTRIERVVRSTVWFDPDGERWLDWYLDLGESPGKAGGYGLQEAADVFVARIEGSLSNIVGLPMKELLHILCSLAPDIMLRLD